MGLRLSVLLLPILFALVPLEATADRFLPDETAIAKLRAYAPSGPVAIIQMAGTGRRPRAVGRWMIVSGKIAEESGGKRVYAGNLDLGPPGHPVLRFELITIDEYPSVEEAIQALGTELPIREDALGEWAVLMARPELDRIQEAVAPDAGSRPVDAPEPPPLSFPDDSGPGLDADVARAFMADVQNQSLVVLELVQLRDRAAGTSEDTPLHATEPAQAPWTRYWNASTKRLMGLGGGPLWRASAPRLLIGGEDDALAGAWSEIDLVYAPDRYSYRALYATDAQRESLRHRSAALERAVVIPGAPWPMYDPAD